MSIIDTLQEHLPYGTRERLKDAAPLLLDLLLIGILIYWGLAQWPMGGTGLPFWATAPDQFLFGPDAAAWAANAQAFFDGRYADLDYHRMPGWTLLTYGTLALGYPVALAGHLVNHLLHLLLPVTLYLLGRMGGSRGAGFGAGLMIAINLHLLFTSRAFGVDTTIATLIPMMLLTSLWTGRIWWLAPLSGLVATLVSSAHFTSIPFVVPSVVLVMLSGRPGWRRFAGTLLHVAAAAGSFYLIFQIFQFPDRNQLALAVQEGAVAGSTRGVADTNWTHLRALIEANGQKGVDNCIRLMLTNLRPIWLPWTLALALPWIGAVGTFLGVRRPEDARQSFLKYFDWKQGLALVLCLGPLPFLSMANAPERYSYNLLPIVLLLMWRGVASMLAAVDWGLKQAWKDWPAGASCILLALVVGQKTLTDAGNRTQPLPPPADAVVAQAAGSALAELIPPIGGVASPMRELTVYAGRSYCPVSNCPFGSEEIDMRRCIVLMDKECAGEGPLPYVVIHYPQGQEGRSQGRQLMDAWVVQHWTPAKQISSYGYSVDLILIPREEAKAMLKGGPTP